MQNMNENALKNAINKLYEEIENLNSLKQKFNIKKIFFQNVTNNEHFARI